VGIFVFLTLVSLSCSVSSLYIDFFLDRSLLRSELLVLEVRIRPLTLGFEPSLLGDSLRVLRLTRSDSKRVRDLSSDGDRDFSLD
jgi:hypothetical protein